MIIKFQKQKDQEHKIQRILAKESEESAQKIAEETGFPYLNLAFKPIQKSALEIVPEEKAKQSGIAVISQRGDALTVVAQNPENTITKGVLEELKGRFRNVNIFIVSQYGLRRAWAIYLQKTGSKISGEIDISKETFEHFHQTITNIKILKEKIDEMSSGQDVSVVLELILASAVTLNASDIHIEPEQHAIQLRMRIDGIMYDVSKFDSHAYRLILSRIKLLSNMKLNVHGTSQDGRFAIAFQDNEIQVRTSVLPGEFGENIVMRLLNPKSLLSLEDLGLNPDLLSLVDKELTRPNGMIVVCGPTGSGKTTTLYAFLQKLKTPAVKIITIEDPVEYRLEGISQTQVSPDEGYTFATGLRSILRQDPDIILVGEIRDLETVDIALQAALTGHLVFSTLHANDAAGTIPRMMDLGASSSTIGPAVNMSISQRLLRRVCQDCRTSIKIKPDELFKLKNELTITDKAAKNLHYFQKMVKVLTLDMAISVPSGCEQCNGTGYKGRIALYEIMLVDYDLEKFLVDVNPSVTEIKEFARNRGMITLKQDGFLKVLEGITTIEEVEKTTD